MRIAQTNSLETTRSPLEACKPSGARTYLPSSLYVYLYSSRPSTREGLSQLQAKVKEGKKKAWMLSVGFKQPHTWYHMPMKYFEMYRNSTALADELDDRDLVFPANTPTVGYRCCALERITYMNQDGRLPSVQFEVPRYAMKVQLPRY